MIGYYVHHHGRGHAHRARAIAAHLREDVVVLSSLPDEGWAAGWVQLERDDAVPGRTPTAGGRLHWAPLGNPGYSARMAQVADWVARANPRLVVVDVSVEITALVRLLGVPVLVATMPGERDDAAHVLGYDLASRLMTLWPRELGVEPSLARYEDKTDFVGVISAHDGREIPSAAAHSEPTVLLLSGAGGNAITADDIAAARAQTPGWRWEVVGELGTWHDDVWPLLATADVVVTHAGQNAVADVAAAGRPAVVIAQDRPHGEQAATARLLARNDIATVVDAWPDDWARVLEEAVARPNRWGALQVAGAAARAAAAIENAAVENAAVEKATGGSR